MKKIIILSMAFFCIQQTYAQFMSMGDVPEDVLNAKAKNMATLTQFSSSQSSTKIEDVPYDKDVVYDHQSDVDLHLQIIRPQMDKDKKYPCVMYIPGSAWFKQDCYSRIPTFYEFSKRGYVVVIMEYRPSTTAAFPAQIQDTKSALRFLHKNADKYGIDEKNISIWGDSSGGHLSLLGTLTQDQPTLDSKDFGKGSISVNACIAYYPVTDILNLQVPGGFDHTSANSPEGTLFGHVKVLDNPDKAKQASPITYVDKRNASKIAPILIMTGNNDHVLAFTQSVRMADKLDECGYKYKFYKIENGDHGSWQFWTKEAFDIVDKFLKDNKK